MEATRVKAGLFGCCSLAIGSSGRILISVSPKSTANRVYHHGSTSNYIRHCLQKTQPCNIVPVPDLTPPDRPAQPNLVEAEYKRVGALNLFAAFDRHSGRVYAHTAPRKRQLEFIAFLEQLDQSIDEAINRIHLVMDNVRMHKGKLVQTWLAAHPRFRCYFPPVHCSWMNQVEQGFSILQRQRFSIADFESLGALAEALQAFVVQWNAKAHNFKWNQASFAKVLAKCEVATLEGAA